MIHVLLLSVGFTIGFITSALLSMTDTRPPSRRKAPPPANRHASEGEDR